MPYRRKGSRKSFAKRKPQRRFLRKDRKLVTGHGPTLVEQIASGAGSVAKLATSILPMISAINTEAKYIDYSATVTSNTPGTNDSINLLTDVNPGTGDSDRIGNSILAKDLSVRMAINFTPSATVFGLHCRAMLICWKTDATHNAISSAKLFEDPTNLYSPINKDYSDQMVVLKDKFFALNAQNPGTGTIPMSFVHMKIFKKLDWHMRWQDGSGSPTLNHIYLVLRSSASSPSMSTTYYSRLNYTDN